LIKLRYLTSLIYLINLGEVWKHLVVLLDKLDTLDKLEDGGHTCRSYFIHLTHLKHLKFQIYLINLVHLIHLIHLVHLIQLIHLVHLIHNIHLIDLISKNFITQSQTITIPRVAFTPKKSYTSYTFKISNIYNMSESDIV
jgi:hypothetical protein